MKSMFSELLKLIFNLVKLVCTPIVLIPLGAVAAFFFCKCVIFYRRSSYYKVTRLPYHVMSRDTGRYGEYLTYKCLRKYEKNGARLLFNVYVPKENDETSEIDVLMICEKGLFVFESKNYSGWIFGDSEQKYWYQTLPQGRGKSHKERFYNPIMQNSAHIKYLKTFAGQSFPVYSVIVFSERCTLKNVNVRDKGIAVINREYLTKTVDDILNGIQGAPLAEADVAGLYDKLYPYTQVGDDVKRQHIDDIQKMLEPTADDEKTEAVTTASAAEESEHIPAESAEPMPPAGGDAPETDSVAASEKAPTLICPECGGTLVVRTARRGANAGERFYGCSNYPKCRYIKKI